MTQIRFSFDSFKLYNVANSAPFMFYHDRQSFLRIAETLREECGKQYYPYLLVYYYHPNTRLRQMDLYLLKYALGDDSFSRNDVENASRDEFLRWQGNLSSETRQRIGNEIFAVMEKIWTKYFSDAGMHQEFERMREEVRQLTEQNSDLAETVGRLKESAAPPILRKQPERDFSTERYEQLEALKRDIAARRAEVESELAEKRQTALANLRKETDDRRIEMERDLAEERQAALANLRKEMDDRRIEMECDLAEKRAAALAQLKSTAQYAIQQEEYRQYLDSVSEMVDHRQETVNSLANEMRGTTAALRDGSAQITENLRSSLEGALEDARKNLQRLVENAVNNVVNAENRLRNDDFNDLLEGYNKMEESLYYKRKRETEWFADYERQVTALLRSLEKTLSKLGFVRFSPTPGEPYNEETMTEFEDADIPAVLTDTSKVLLCVTSGFSQNNEVVIPAAVLICD